MTYYSPVQFMSDEGRAYYDGGKRAVVDGVPCRMPAWYRQRIAGKDTIKAMVAAGEAIDAGSLAGAERFRFVPCEGEAKLPDYGKPSARGTTKCSDARTFKSSWYRPSRLSNDPNYTTPMTDECDALRKARKEWAGGNPKPVREWLAKSAKARGAQWAMIDACRAVAEIAKAFGNPLSFNGRIEAERVAEREALFDGIDVGRVIGDFAKAFAEAVPARAKRGAKAVEPVEPVIAEPVERVPSVLDRWLSGRSLDEIRPPVQGDSMSRPAMTPKQFRALREKLEWTQEDMANWGGVTARTIMRFESGEQPVPKIWKQALESVKLEHAFR